LEAADPALFMNVSVESAFDAAFENRPDLEQARLAVELRKIDTKISRSEYLPTVNAFANFNYMGRVPDDRSFIQSSADDPFTFSQGTNSFFSRNYWNPTIAAGVRLSWNLFDGFQTSARVQQKQVAVSKAEVELDQTIEMVRLEVNNAVRDLEAARRRIQSQNQNVANAELNYEYAQARLSEGVATQLEERNASEQLDLSRLNYLQAVHDYLVARSAFQTAIGMPLASSNLLQLTSK
jgi:outer membrane protein TolC